MSTKDKTSGVGFKGKAEVKIDPDVKPGFKGKAEVKVDPEVKPGFKGPAPVTPVTKP
ncbi:hypothetical protein [Pseudomonas gingeri]|uniref:hypothetical protein n=1 Tax=Pseudomonas gingeri TaxID=117681 RepID=UPI0015C09B86|nr:hypothetical protein [Pseudomonas gingeri]NWD50546.1 hypothetical protein [Pseudomonas gingeri]